MKRFICHSLLVTSLLISLSIGVVRADDESIEQQLIGVWKLEPREYHRIGWSFYQFEGTIQITEKLPDGTYVVLGRITSRSVAEPGFNFSIPGCENERECITDDASEGIGDFRNGVLYIDWFGDNWLDDKLTLTENRLAGADANGPVILVKDE